MSTPLCKIEICKSCEMYSLWTTTGQEGWKHYCSHHQYAVVLIPDKSHIPKDCPYLLEYLMLNEINKG